jgi:N-methylhydantoinase A/oxoprolinase/acetone carboxylase beta subunit
VLDVGASASALARAGVDPEGVVAVVNAAMEQAVRSVTVARGVDPRTCALVAFGGAGPLHACALADALGVTTVIVPARAGVLSAVGLLGAPLQREIVRSWPTPSSTEGIESALEALAGDARELVGVAAATSTFVDVRYAGQSHELTVTSVEDFHDEHARRNGYARPDAPLEVVSLRARARIESRVSLESLRPPSVQRRPARGPAVIAEPDCTIWVAPGWAARVGSAGALVVERFGS